MSEPACPTPGGSPRCPRCGAALARTSLPPGVFGLEGEPCVECNDATATRPVPWACRACGGLWLIESQPSG